MLNNNGPNMEPCGTQKVFAVSKRFDRKTGTFGHT